jgi:anti-sigma28 factor (negative regulator of flagellin synthesis)
MRVVSLRKAWNSWTVCDSDGHGLWGKEDKSRQPYGKMCRGCTTDSSTTGAGRLFHVNNMTKSLERAMDLSDVRIEMVARVRSAIANGCYNVSSADLAQKLIRNMLGDFR